MAHEILVDLFKSRPSLAAEILVEVMGHSLPSYREARLASIDLTEIKPAEYRADLMVLLTDGDAVLRGIVLEVQLSVDAGKRRSWPAYVTVAHAQHGCLIDLLVVAPDPAVAAWCETPIPLGPKGFVLTPPVLRRESVPVVTDHAEAASRLELGMLSVMAHGQTEQGAAIAEALLPAIATLDEERARFYFDLLVNSVNHAARRALEAMMKGYEYQSDFAKKYVAEGRKEGHKEGHQEGRKEGRKEGEVAARAHAILTVFRVRGIAVPEAVCERILAESDADRLERWLEKAAVAASIAEALDEPS